MGRKTKMGKKAEEGMLYLLSQSVYQKSKEKLVLACLEGDNAWFNWIKC